MKLVVVIALAMTVTAEPAQVGLQSCREIVYVGPQVPAPSRGRQVKRTPPVAAGTAEKASTDAGCTVRTPGHTRGSRIVTHLRL